MPGDTLIGERQPDTAPSRRSLQVWNRLRSSAAQLALAERGPFGLVSPPRRCRRRRVQKARSAEQVPLHRRQARAAMKAKFLHAGHTHTHARRERRPLFRETASSIPADTPYLYRKHLKLQTPPPESRASATMCRQGQRFWEWFFAFPAAHRNDLTNHGKMCDNQQVGGRQHNPRMLHLKLLT